MSKPPHIVLFEHDRLTVGQSYEYVDGGAFMFTAKHFDALARYAGRVAWKPYTLGHRCVRFGGFVGTLCVGRLLIEILPKADRHAWQTDDRTYWQNALTLMLRVARKSRLEHASLAPLHTHHGTLLDLYVERYIQCVEQIVHHGLVRRYRRVEGNQTTFRGRLRVAPHIRHNSVHAERFFVEYSSYDHQHLANEVLFAALHVVRDLPIAADLQGRCRRCLLAFPELTPRRITPRNLEALPLDRATDRYREALELARLLLLHHTPGLQSGDLNVLAILVNMSRLFEDFLGQLCRHLPLPGLRVKLQYSVPFWSPDAGPDRQLRPDIVLERDGYRALVIDAKWKTLPAAGPSMEDIRQIYAYNQYFAASHSILLYPRSVRSERASTGLFHSHDHRLSTATMNLATGAKVDKNELIRQLRELVEKSSIVAAKKGPA